MGHAFDFITQTFGEVVHRINAPLVAAAVVGLVANSVEGWVAHIHVRRRHVDLRPQHVFTVGKLAGTHTAKQIEILADTSVAVGAFDAWFRQGAAVLPDLVAAETIDVGDPLLDQDDGKVEQFFVVVGGKILAVAPVEA